MNWNSNKTMYHYLLKYKLFLVNMDYIFSMYTYFKELLVQKFNFKIFFYMPLIIIGFVSAIKSNMLRNFILKKISAEIETREVIVDHVHSDLFKSKSYRLKTIDNVEIRAWVVEPNEINEETKYAILFHGNSLNRKTFLREFGVFDMIVKHNLILMIPDYRGFGDSENDFNFETVPYDIDACFECYRRLYSDKPIHFISFSLGGTVVLEYISFISDPKKNRESGLENKPLDGNFFEATQLYLNKPEKIILVAPFISLSDTVVQLTKRFRLFNILLNYIPLGLDKLVRLNPLRNIDYLSKNNTLLVYSDNDDLIPLRSVEKLFNNAEVRLLKGVDHCDTFSRHTWVYIMNFINYN